MCKISITRSACIISSEAPMTAEDWIRETSNAKQLELEAKAIEHDANERKSNS